NPFVSLAQRTRTGLTRGESELDSRDRAALISRRKFRETSNDVDVDAEKEDCGGPVKGDREEKAGEANYRGVCPPGNLLIRS
ncbi:hypothetical protein K0M31_000489, partial [Melipona bicolor]